MSSQVLCHGDVRKPLKLSLWEGWIMKKKMCHIKLLSLVRETSVYQCRFPGVPHKGNLIREVENIHFLFLLMTSTT